MSANGHPRLRRNHRFIAIVTSLALLGGTAATAAHADDILATGGVYGGVSQAFAICYVFNAGSRPASILSAVIRDQSGAVVPNLSVNNCTGVSLNPTQTCALDARVGNQAYSCTILADRAAGLRGVLDMRGAGSNVLTGSNLVATPGPDNDHH